MSVRFPLGKFSTWHQLRQKNSVINYPLKEQICRIMQRWEDFFGITAVRLAQEEVINVRFPSCLFFKVVLAKSKVSCVKTAGFQCENRLTEAQKNRRAKQMELKKLQNHLKDIHAELDRTSRGDDR